MCPVSLAPEWNIPCTVVWSPWDLSIHLSFYVLPVAQMLMITGLGIVQGCFGWQPGDSRTSVPAGGVVTAAIPKGDPHQWPTPVSGLWHLVLMLAVPLVVFAVKTGSMRAIRFPAFYTDDWREREGILLGKEQKYLPPLHNRKFPHCFHSRSPQCWENLQSVLPSLCCWNMNRSYHCTAILWRETEEKSWFGIMKSNHAREGMWWQVKEF